MKGFFLHDKHKWPCAFVATELKTSGILFAVSTHNPVDIFDRRVARAVAEGRLMTRKGGGGTLVSAGNNVKARVLTVVAADHDMPTRTREAAKRWLKNPPQPKKKKGKAA